jgi:hypothetical protein
MIDKVEDFIDAVIFEYQHPTTEEEARYKEQLVMIFKVKFREVLRSLFSYDKITLLKLLDIGSPTVAQLEGVESLQKDLRMLQRERREDVTDDQIEVFVSKILKVLNFR